MTQKSDDEKVSETNFTFRISTNLKIEFLEAAKKADLSGGQILRRYMKEFINETNKPMK